MLEALEAVIPAIHGTFSLTTVWLRRRSEGGRKGKAEVVEL
jgi:hypothetical protein